MRRGENDGRHPRRGSGATLSMRVVLALGASIGLTAAIALPMAYQAREARREQAATRPERTEVLGATSVAPSSGPPLVTSGLLWIPATDPGDVTTLHGATVRDPGRIRVELDGVVRVDFRVGDGDVMSDLEEPFELPDDGQLDPATLAAAGGEVVATVSFEDGRSEVRQARFEVELR